jgi:hypothetical protein
MKSLTELTNQTANPHSNKLEQSSGVSIHSFGGGLAGTYEIKGPQGCVNIDITDCRSEQEIIDKINSAIALVADTEEWHGIRNDNGSY